MKYTYTILFLIAFSIPGITQLEWDVNETDEFTGERKLIGKWISVWKWPVKNTYMRFGLIGQDVFMQFKHCTGKVMSVDEDDKLYLKLANDTILTFLQQNFQTTGDGKGAIGFAGSKMQGFDFAFQIDKRKLKLLSESHIVKWRFNTNSGYIEEDLKKNEVEVMQYTQFFYNEYDKILNN